MTSPLRKHPCDAAAIALLAAALAAVFTASSIDDDVLKVLVATLRIVDGQLPYRDFMPQVVPLANVLAVPAFVLLPTIGLAVLVLSTVLNVAAALLMWKLVGQLTGSRWGALIAGTLMASWYMQIGGYYFDLVAYLFGLAAFTRLSLREETRVGTTEGLLLACAVLSKQSIGVFCAAAFGLVVLAFFGWRAQLKRRFILAIICFNISALSYILSNGGVWDRREERRAFRVVTNGPQELNEIDTRRRR